MKPRACPLTLPCFKERTGVLGLTSTAVDAKENVSVTKLKAVLTVVGLALSGGSDPSKAACATPVVGEMFSAISGQSVDRDGAKPEGIFRRGGFPGSPKRILSAENRRPTEQYHCQSVDRSCRLDSCAPRSEATRYISQSTITLLCSPWHFLPYYEKNLTIGRNGLGRGKSSFARDGSQVGRSLHRISEMQKPKSKPWRQRFES